MPPTSNSIFPEVTNWKNGRLVSDGLSARYEVLLELRKGKRANPNVIAWARAHLHDRIYISVLSIGEIRKGIELLRAKNPKQCPPFETWLSHLMDQYQDDILPINIEIVERWGEVRYHR